MTTVCFLAKVAYLDPDYMCNVCKLTAKKTITNTKLAIQEGDIVQSQDIDVLFDIAFKHLTQAEQRTNVGFAPRRYVVTGIHSESRKIFATVRVLMPNGCVEGPEVPVLLEFESKRLFPLEKVVVLERTC